MVMDNESDSLSIKLSGVVMDKVGYKLVSGLKYLTAVLLTVMAVLVMGNVVMRYFFNSSVTWAEEVSRFVFVWLVFIGSIVAFNDNEHLGVDTLVNKLSAKGKKVLYIINCFVIFSTAALTLHGSIALTMLNFDLSSPAIGLPYAYVYSSGIIFAVGMGLIIAKNLYKLLSGKMSENDLVMTTDSEENISGIEEIAKNTAKLGNQTPNSTGGAK